MSELDVSDALDTAAADESEQVAIRKQKLRELRASGNAYPNTFRRDSLAQNIHDRFAALEPDELEQVSESFLVAGRIMTRRIMGKASFIHIQDVSGQMQAYLMRDALPEGVYKQFKTWDLGDIVGLQGTLFKTKTGELTLRATRIELITKALRPLPEKYHGLTNVEQRYRQRYLDLISNADARAVFAARSACITVMRNVLDAHQFMEVETPMMQVIPGGATAKPFITHHESLDLQMYMRISPELYLKRLLVGGFERVYEINRNFRNEGLSTRHNPEFTMVEYYQAYADYHEAMAFLEYMLREIAEKVLGKLQFESQGHQFDLSKPFTRMTIQESILAYNDNVTADDLGEFEQAAKLAQSLGIAVQPKWGLGKILLEIFESTVESKLMAPTFITAYPAEVSPLARCNDADPFFTDRFELFIGGREIANGFSELNDPEDQAARFRRQVEEKEAGDEEAMFYDEDYVTALEHGMPPAAGVGIGIDRLVMFLTDSPSIRDVILFPHMKPQAN